MTFWRSYGCVCTVLAAAAAIATGLLAQESALRQVNYPHVDIGLASLQARQKAQLATADQIKAFHNFHFTESLQQSGITFRNRAVRYAKDQYMPVHYDHGTAVAVADVDGDGLYDIYFVSQLGGNELYKNLGNGKFQNITRDAGVAMLNSVNVGAAFADVNNSGHQDLYVTTVDDGNVLFQNDGHGHFKDITAEAGLQLKAHSSGAFFFDYDRDGLPDLLVCNVGVYTTGQKDADGVYVGLPDAFAGHLRPERFEHPVLYKNLGNYKFKDVTAEVGLHPNGWCGDATFADPNATGWPGIYFLNMQGANHYYENLQGKRFAEKTDAYFPKTPWGAMGIKFFDYDNDGRMDLLLTDMHSDMMQAQSPDQEKQKIESHFPDRYLGGPADHYIFGNAFYHNLGNGSFEEISDQIGVEQMWPWGVSVADINADGFQDIFVTAGMSFPFRYGINSMLLNNQGQKFADAEFILGIEPRPHPYAPWFQIDCDDRTIANPAAKDACAGETGKIEVMAPKSSRSSVIFDIENDGDLDIVTNDFNSEPQILLSNLREQTAIHWAKIVLVGTASNRNGLGATVKVTADGHIYTQYMDGKSGYLSQSVLPLYFGLAAAAKIDRVEVDWPSGRKQILTTGIPENQVLHITEPR